MRKRLIAAGLATIVAAATLTASASGQADLVQDGNLLVSFDGAISPKALPRAQTAPVAVKVETAIRATDGSDPPPQLRSITIGINRQGKIFDRGLPTCRVREIQPTTIAAARRICGGAIVGNGNVGVRVHLPNQPPFTFKGPLLVFNAERAGGKRQLLAQVYGTRPPSAFVLRFTIDRRKGTFGTQIRTVLPQAARRWAYLTHFQMRLKRTYTFRGKRHSYVNAACAAPAGFPGAVYPFARANFEFAGGRRIDSTLLRDCKVRP
ncbi:MAG TPA: hypothetical protein VFU04_09130 [Solirubrobacterales bacterium]|nr:hypothetical protein [Solirubrobacterales bacterium]